MRDATRNGPPVRAPPRNLKAEEAEFVYEQLDKEVLAGQLELAADFAARERQRKRGIVVDYRRVNRWTQRVVYFARNQEDEIANARLRSAFLTPVDTCKGFNQIANA